MLSEQASTAHTSAWVYAQLPLSAQAVQPTQAHWQTHSRRYLHRHSASNASTCVNAQPPLSAQARLIPRKYVGKRTAAVIDTSIAHTSTWADAKPLLSAQAWRSSRKRMGRRAFTLLSAQVCRNAQANGQAHSRHYQYKQRTPRKHTYNLAALPPHRPPT